MFDAEKKYLSISEISKITQVPSYTLRYWEKEFKLLKPERRSGNRKYSAQDVELINKIKDLLYKKKFTIDGVKKVLNGDKRVKQSNDKQVLNSKILENLKQDLEDLLQTLKN